MPQHTTLQHTAPQHYNIPQQTTLQHTALQHTTRPTLDMGQRIIMGIVPPAGPAVSAKSYSFVWWVQISNRG